MFFSDRGADPALKNMNGKLYPHPPLLFKACGSQTTMENGRSESGRRIEYLIGFLPAAKIEAMKSAGSVVPSARKHLSASGNPRIKVARAYD
jgi:hypothetical protein